MLRAFMAPVPVIVIGATPMTVNAAQETEPEQETEVVPMLPIVFSPVQYVRPPIAGFVEVASPIHESVVPENWRGNDVESPESGEEFVIVSPFAPTADAVPEIVMPVP